MALRHILMVPVPAYGHIIPLLELAKKLTVDHRVTFAVSEHLFDDVKRRELIHKDDKNITLLSIKHDGFVLDPADGTAGAKNIELLMLTFNTALEHFLASILSIKDHRLSVSEFGAVDVVVADNFLSRQLSVCYQEDVTVYHFNTASAEAMLLKGLLFDLNSPSYVEPDGSFPLWWNPERSLQPLPPDEIDIMRGIKETTPLVRGVIVNSSRGLEATVLEKVKQVPGMGQKPIYMVGPLIPPEKVTNNTKEEHSSAFIVEWLDQKEINSVVYISFGTIASPKPDQLVELANAFLSMGRSFIWSLSETLFSSLPENIRDQRPISPDSNFLILNWVPQKIVLTHASTGVFLSHCGWNSTLEALSSGVPVICWPMFADQGLNAQLLARNGVGLVIEGTGMKAQRVVPANEIATTINAFISNQEIRKKALALKWVLHSAVGPGGSSDRDLNAFRNAL